MGRLVAGRRRPATASAGSYQAALDTGDGGAALSSSPPPLIPSSAGAAVALPSAAEVRTIHEYLLAWYGRRARALPWRERPTPYGVLVAEFMLQQTQAERVAPRYREFLARFPDVAALARASAAEVLRAWSGLGYNVRARRLQEIARAVTAQYGGHVPEDMAALLALRGIGRYTAAAVACFAFGRQVATVDTNIRRVLQRVFVGPDATSRLAERALWALAERALPAGRAADWNQALMDLGATVCTARAPACPSCPLEGQCRAREAQRRTGAPIAAPAGGRARGKGEGPFAGSSRYYRGRIVRALTELAPGEALSLPALGARIKEDYAPYEAGWLGEVVGGLARDGLVSVRRQAEETVVALPEAGPGEGDGGMRG